jgi:hypothetical protein
MSMAGRLTTNTTRRTRRVQVQGRISADNGSAMTLAAPEGRTSSPFIAASGFSVERVASTQSMLGFVGDPDDP